VCDGRQPTKAASAVSTKASSRAVGRALASIARAAAATSAAWHSVSILRVCRFRILGYGGVGSTSAWLLLALAMQNCSGATHGALACPPSRQPMIRELRSVSVPVRAVQAMRHIHWSPRKSPRDIFSVFFLGAARSFVSHSPSQNCRCTARGKKAASRAPPAFSAPAGEGCLPMIAVLLVGNAQSESARCLSVGVESRSSALGRCSGWLWGGVVGAWARSTSFREMCCKLLFVGWPA
jgi:hypothetical protein